MKRFFFCSFLFYISFSFSQNLHKETRTFAQKEGRDLKMDIYRSEVSTKGCQPCLIFLFGGGFKEGTRDAEKYHPYFKYFTNKGFMVVSIDYRLGMKGQKAPSVFNQKPLIRAIKIAVEDLYSATSYLLKNADGLQLDTTQFIVSGSSAGAVTVLQADYEKREGNPIAEILPLSFNYAGVIAFSGAIYSEEGTPSYAQSPAPTLFFHGSADRLVPYNKMRFFNKGMFGSKALVKRFKQDGYPFVFYSITNIGHEVSEYPMWEFQDEIYDFIRDFVFDKKQWQIEIDFYDKFRKSDTSTNPNSYYN